jgi:hypothetical protein
MERRSTDRRLYGWVYMLCGVCALALGGTTMAETCLSPYATQAPFPYLLGDSREWPILERALPKGARFTLTARAGDTVLATGERLRFRGLRVTVTRAGRLRVKAEKDSTAGAFRLELTLAAPGTAAEAQALEVRPAPPDRPISYYADFCDDLIRTFMDTDTGRFSPLTRNGIDQYFRRVQAHGTRRLIVWLSPFPYIADRANYAAGDWERHEQQARAILDSGELTAALNARKGQKTWEWMRYLMAARLNPDFGRWLGQSAADHGIALTMSYRPFEAALTKYYEIPAFDQDGTYLWGFLPLASPTTNYHPDQVGWRHYREVLREIGQADAATLTTIELPGVTDPARFVGQPGLQITLAPLPPVADDAFVLVRDAAGQFRLRPFATLREAADSKLPRLESFQVEAAADGLRLSGLQVPPQCRYLILSWTGTGEGPDLSALSPVILRAKAGNRLGRETSYWVLGGPTDPTRLAAITADGEYRVEFQASEFSQRTVAKGPERLTLAGRQLVIDLGEPATVELIDFNQPLARQNAVREIATVLALPGFEGIFVNTRSHTDLPLSMAFGTRGQLPAGQYWGNDWGMLNHLGLDKAYLPRSAASLDLVRELVRQPEGIERITTWQPGEWTGPCQTPEGPPGRYARNRGTADGMRRLLEDLEQAFPRQRIRVVIPLGEAAVRRVEAGLDAMPQPNGTPYGHDYYRFLWAGNNHSPAAGEGLAMVDLRGLSVEPAFLGSGGSEPDRGPFELYVREGLTDLADQRGAPFRGPRSYFYEAQATLRATDLAAARRAREEVICHLLAQRQDIGEVILYEAADWLYFMPLADADLCGHGFLDRCGAK